MLILILSGCFEEEKSSSNRFVGEWKTENDEDLKMYDTGDCYFLQYNKGTWELKDDMLIITIPMTHGKNTLGYSYEFSNNNNTLSLTDARGLLYTFHRQ